MLKIIAFLAIPALVLAFLLWRNHRRAQTRRQSTCGEIAHPGGTMDAQSWFIGPDLSHIGPAPDWGNKSPGCPTHPTPLQPGPGWYVDVPVGENLPLGQGDKLDSITFKHGSLSGHSYISLRYQVEGGTLLAVPEEDPRGKYPARMTVYFQREGDDWSTEGAMEAYRWYYTGVEVYLEPGVHEILIPLDHGWTATQTSTMESNPKGFADAIANACCVGIGFGGNEVGRIHGMRAVEPARFSLLAFTVE